MITVGFRPVSSLFANPHRLWSWMGPGMSVIRLRQRSASSFFSERKENFFEFFFEFLHATD
jgi:hypothetical protein